MSIIVYLESYDGKLTGGAKEAVGFANQYSTKKDTDVIGVVIDKNPEAVIEEAKSIGIATLRKKKVDNYNSKAYSNYLAQAGTDAEAIVLPTSSWGQEICAYLSVKLEGNPITDIVGLGEGEDEFLRSVHSNSVIATMEGDEPLILTLRSGSFDAPEESSSDIDSQELDPEEGYDSITVEKIEELKAERIPLTEADRIVTAGRGVGDKEKLTVINNIADQINAAVGATRAIVDDGWVAVDLQIGQTGKTVSPSLYIAAGVSGAIQHITGMKTSDVIVAINTDPEAPIFDICDYGIVADLHEVIPEIIKQLKERE